MDRYQQKLSRYENVTASTQVAVGDDLSTVARALVAAKDGFTVFIQRIVFSLSTADKTKSFTVIDTSGTPVVIAKINGTSDPSDVASTPGERIIDFGPEGYAVVEGKGVSLKNSAAGLVSGVVVQMYRRRTANFVGNSAPFAPVQP